MTAEPMTTEELARIRATLDETPVIAQGTGDGWTFTDQGRAWLKDITRTGRALLAEVDRLRERNADLFRRLGEHMDDLGDMTAERDRLYAELIDPEAVAHNAAVDAAHSDDPYVCERLGCGHATDLCHGLACSCGCPYVLRVGSETTRPPAQPGHGEPQTPEGSTDRGTPVPGPHGRSEAVPQTASERIEQIRTALADLDIVDHGIVGIKGRYGWNFSSPEGRRAMHADLAWLLDHVDRLNVVLADEVPDVDGWTLQDTPFGVMVSHSTNAGERVLTAGREPLPVGAVLAFIADQRGRADER